MIDGEAAAYYDDFDDARPATPKMPAFAHDDDDDFGLPITCYARSDDDAA